MVKSGKHLKNLALFLVRRCLLSTRLAIFQLPTVTGSGSRSLEGRSGETGRRCALDSPEKFRKKHQTSGWTEDLLNLTFGWNMTKLWKWSRKKGKCSEKSRSMAPDSDGRGEVRHSKWMAKLPAAIATKPLPFRRWKMWKYTPTGVGMIWQNSCEKTECCWEGWECRLFRVTKCLLQIQNSSKLPPFGKVFVSKIRPFAIPSYQLALPTKCFGHESGIGRTQKLYVAYIHT